MYFDLLKAFDCRNFKIGKNTREPSNTETMNPEPSNTATMNSEPSNTATMNPEPSNTATMNPKPSNTTTMNPEPSNTATIRPISAARILHIPKIGSVNLPQGYACMR